MNRILFLYSFLILGITLPAQTKTFSPSSNITKHLSSEIKKDSSKTNPDTKSTLKRLKMIQVEDTITMSDFMMSIERINGNLNVIRDSAELDLEAVHLLKRINNITNSINIIRQNARNKHSAINTKSIYLYQSFATTLSEENSRIRSRIDLLYNRTYHAKLHLTTVLNDSVFKDLKTETDIPIELNKKLIRLERKWKRTDSIVKSSIDSINILKIRTSDNSINLSNMLFIMDERLDKARPEIFGQEVSFLWQFKKSLTQSSDTTKTLNILSSEHNAIGYYMSETNGRKEFLLFMSVLLFLWLYFKRKLLKTISENKDTYSFLHLKYLNKNPYLALFVLLIMCMMSFFDTYAPTLYIVIEYILVLGAASVIFSRKYKPSFLHFWFALAILFIVNAFIYLLIEPTLIGRLLMLSVHIIILVYSISFYKHLPKNSPYYKWIKPAIFISIILMLLAIICNLFGRFSLSGLLGLSAIFAITQVLILPVFIDIVMEFILLQLLSSRLKKGVESPFDCTTVTNKIEMPLILITLVFWITMLTSNLNIFDVIYDAIVEALTATRSVGSITFKLTNVFLFIAIIWFAHILQRLISFLFGETGSDSEDMVSVNKGQHSRLLITRLLVLVVGYLLAIAASGLPIDKLTFLLGALGLGIGMGLSNIVNNFVSGVILIFDGTLQIGDEIEVAGQAGQVKEIGLRASTLRTADGAEVIIPNGSILSQNIVNWNLTNDQKRITLTFTLTGKELDANMVNELINTTLEQITGVISKRTPVILYTKVTAETLSLTVRCWSVISNVEQVKSEAMLMLSSVFTAKNIGFE
jgi:potassium efflux system protein